MEATRPRQADATRAEPGLPPAPRRAAAEPGTAIRVVQAAGIVALTSAAAALARAFLHVQDVEMIFLVGVMVAALTAGRGAAFVAAALSVACFDYFFVPP